MEEIIVHTNYFSGTEHANHIQGFAIVAGVLTLILLVVTMFCWADKIFSWAIPLTFFTIIAVISTVMLGLTTVREYNQEEEKVVSQLEDYGFNRINLNTDDWSQFYAYKGSDLKACAAIEVGKDTFNIVCEG